MDLYCKKNIGLFCTMIFIIENTKNCILLFFFYIHCFYLFFILLLFVYQLISLYSLYKFHSIYHSNPFYMTNFDLISKTFYPKFIFTLACLLFFTIFFLNFTDLQIFCNQYTSIEYNICKITL